MSLVAKVTDLNPLKWIIFFWCFTSQLSPPSSLLLAFVLILLLFPDFYFPLFLLLFTFIRPFSVAYSFLSFFPVLFILFCVTYFSTFPSFFWLFLHLFLFYLHSIIYFFKESNRIAFTAHISSLPTKGFIVIPAVACSMTPPAQCHMRNARINKLLTTYEPSSVSWLSVHGVSARFPPLSFLNELAAINEHNRHLPTLL